MAEARSFIFGVHSLYKEYYQQLQNYGKEA